jgi:hypothetical protein
LQAMREEEPTSTKHVPLKGVMHAVTSTVATLGAKLIPAHSSRDWRRRWAEAQRHLARLDQLRTDELSADAVNAARHELHSFFVQTYHLKDALIADAAMPEQTVEDAVTASPDLALLADLANLDKHGRLTRRPRSRTVPQVGDPAGIADGAAPGWRLSVPIRHGTANLDGLAVARRAVQAWEQELRQWGLI